jgi:hypothetical protein
MKLGIEILSLLAAVCLFLCRTSRGRTTRQGGGGLAAGIDYRIRSGNRFFFFLFSLFPQKE